MFIFWFTLCISFIALELFNPGLFFFLSLAASALFIVFIEWYTPVSQNLQYLLFFATSAVLFLFLKKAVKKTLQINAQSYVPHLQDLIGSRVTITLVISPNTGYVTIDGTAWVVITAPNTILTINTVVLITGIKGNQLLAKISHH